MATMSKVGEHINSEVGSHFSLLTQEMVDLRKEFECSQLAMETLARKVDNLCVKVESIEVAMENADVGVLKDVFGLSNPTPASVSDGSPPISSQAHLVENPSL